MRPTDKAAVHRKKNTKLLMRCSTCGSVRCLKSMTFLMSASFRVKATACSMPTATAPNSCRAHMMRFCVSTATLAAPSAVSRLPRRDVGRWRTTSSPLASVKVSSSTQSPRVSVVCSLARCHGTVENDCEAKLRREARTCHSAEVRLTKKENARSGSVRRRG